MSATTRTGGGVSQRHTACDCPRAHTAGCSGERCRCPREHSAQCAHRVRPGGKTSCGCPWAYAASAVRAGKRMQATGSGYKSRSAALRARTEAIATLRKAPASAKRGQTLGDWLTAWLDRRSTGSNVLRPTTLAEYTRLSEIIRTAIGGELLRDVTADTLDQLERHLHKTLPDKATTHARVFAVMQTTLRDAYRRGIIADDPTRRRDPVRAPKVRRAMWQPEQFAQFVAWAQRRGERMAAVYWTAATTGMRRGEMAGLRWVDVNLDAGQLIVAQQAVQVGKQVHVGPVKTAAGQDRLVMLDARTIDALRGVQAQQAEDAQRWGADYQLSGLVFAHEDGSPLSPESITRLFGRAIKRYNAELAIRSLTDPAELQRLANSHGMGTRRLALILADDELTGSPLPAVVFHSLRHLHASVLLASGRGYAAVQRRLGHSSIAVSSNQYGHLIESAARADAEAAAALIPTHRDGAETPRSEDAS